MALTPADIRGALMRPIININGTSRDELARQRTDAMEAMRVALGKVRAMLPNGRDYIGDADALARDQSIHNDRLRLLIALYDAIEVEALCIISDEVRP